MKYNYYYYVEGETEQAILEALKKKGNCIQSGKVEVFNILLRKIPVAKTSVHKPGTVVVLLFDTDIQNSDERVQCLKTLEYNLKTFKASKHIKEVLCVPQVFNLEDELEYACSMNVYDLLSLKHKSTKDFKTHLLKTTNLHEKLSDAGLDIEKLWSKPFPKGWEINGKQLRNESSIIKL